MVNIKAPTAQCRNDDMKHDNQFLARCFGAYMGCEVKVHQDEDLPTTGYLTGIHGEYEAEVQLIEGYHASEEPTYREYKWTKLLLTPLSSISDEDAVDVAKLAYSLPLTRYPKSWVVRRSDRDFLYVESRRNDYSFQVDLVECSVDIFRNDEAVTSGIPVRHSVYIDYLRSKGYDCGYGHIPSLIESGIAIDKTTLNTSCTA